MHILIACEESQRVCEAFRKRGHISYSCDIIDCSGGHPEWHIKQDVLPLLDGNCEFITCDGIKHYQDGKWDMIIAFPPCFEAGSKVMTYDGIKNIEDIQVGDLVLTHKGRYRKVLNIMSKPTSQICRIKTENSGDIYCTPNHPFYTATIENKNHKRVVSDFVWLNPLKFFKEKSPCGNIQKQSYVVNIVDNLFENIEYKGFERRNNQYTPTIVNTLQLEDENFWYLAGRWVGDGWFYKKNQKICGIKICCNKNETLDLKEKIEKAGFPFCLANDKTVNKFEIYNSELANFLFQNFGEYAEHKKISGPVMRLPENLAKKFLEGYFDADGHIQKNGRISFSSVSKDLAYGIKFMVNKYYKVICGITHNGNSNRQIIQGRKVNAKDSYVGVFCPEKRKLSRFINYNDSCILSRYTDIRCYDKNTTVYNLSVEEDESYTINGLAVHNCTHLAVSGAPSFAKKRENGLQEEGLRFFCQFLKADCEKIVIENPVNIVAGNYVTEFFPEIAKEYNLPKKPTQYIQPYEFGDPTRKKTGLWIKGVEPLVPTNIVEPELMTYKDKNGKTKTDTLWHWKTGGGTGKKRSVTYQGIADAMAAQWGNAD